ncbi:MAG: T9SS type A sorting domain-containing protein, partial [Rhodothermaceae bacterium]|nr:T9SS type A sorting domain-containing protein [Rhodothermaceae bacterium]
GLTLGGVGAGTVLEHIEVFASGDDGVEFFGGTVNLKYFVSAFNSDDAIDWDQGWRGKGQFWFVLQGTDKAGAAAEQDGAGGDEHFQPFAIPKIYNVTYVGPGSDASPESDRGEMLMFRDNSGGFYHNSIFTQFNTDKGGHAIQIEDIDNTGSKTEDSRQRFETGDLGLTHNIWWDFGSGTSPQDWIAGSDPAFVTAVLTYLQANGNAIEDPKLRGIDRGPTGAGVLDPRPHGNSPAFTLPRADYPDGDQFFSETDFIGAFGHENWLSGWTALDQLGYSVPTSIEQVSTAEMPSKISLTQNYPNPFNPVTTVEFDLDRAQNVTLSVLDVTGRQVAVLVDDQKSAGTFRVQFDANYLPSGLYLYRLNTQTESLTRKMTLLK